MRGIFSIVRVRLALAILVFLMACLFAGFANEQVKPVLATLDRVVLLIGFVVGAGTLARWIVEGTVGSVRRNSRRK